MNKTFPDPVICSGSLPSKAFQITTYSLLMASSLIGNFLIVGVFYRNKALRTTVHYFIMNMAISDLLYPVVYLPYRLSTKYFDDDGWLAQGVMGNVLCKLALNAGMVSNSVSTFNMMLIAVDRFHAVVSPMKPPIFSRSRCWLLIVFSWFVSVAFCSPLFYFVDHASDDNKLLRCDVNLRLLSQEMTLVTMILTSCITVGIALALTVLYSSIVVRLYRQNSQFNLATEQIQRRAKKKRRITWMLITVVILFYLVWIQVTAINFSFYLKTDVTFPCIYAWLAYEVLLPLYPVVNPVLYYTFNETYRQGFKDLLRCCCPRNVVPVQNTVRVNNTGQINYAIELAQQ